MTLGFPRELYPTCFSLQANVQGRLRDFMLVAEQLQDQSRGGRKTAPRLISPRRGKDQHYHQNEQSERYGESHCPLVRLLRTKRRSAELFFSEKNYSAVRHGD